MTVTREQQRIYPVAKERLIAAVRHSLREGPRYQVVKDGVDGSFEVVHEPWLFLIASTPLLIRVKAVGDSAAVTVRVQSHWLVLGDVFGGYDRIIQGFLDTLGAYLQDA